MTKNKKIILFLCILCSVLCLCGAFLFLRAGTEKAKEVKPDLVGLHDFSITQGEELPDLKEKIRATKTVKEVQIDVSKVDRKTPGTYPVTCSYRDTKGTVHKQTVQCTVTKKNGQEKEAETKAEETEHAGQDAEKSQTGSQTGKTPPVRTGDAERITGWGMACMTSFYVICWMFWMCGTGYWKKTRRI